MIDLRLNHVSKRYRLRRTAKPDRPRQPLLKKIRALFGDSDEFWALRDVSFEVERGETLGIVGHNGAGKSTILKLLSSVTTPTSGEITIGGRLSSLIEVGSGFHPELSGRENIYLSGSILGMRRAEIRDKLERIIEFSGIGKFIDTPVKFYSSGMYIRLGFSVAAHLEADILLLDEVLAVGDAAFQAKCLTRIAELHRQGLTIVFISHNLRIVEQLCNRVLLLNHGQITASGAARDVIEKYQNVTSRYTPTEHQSVAEANLTREVEITSVSCSDEDNRPVASLRTGDAMKLRVSFVVHKPVSDAIIEAYVFNVANGTADSSCQLTTASPQGKGFPLEVGPGVVEFQIDELSFLPGMYHLSATIIHADFLRGIDWQHQCLTLRVDQGKLTRGSFYMPHRWRSLPSATSPSSSARD